MSWLWQATNASASSNASAGYWTQSRGAACSLWVILPALVLYEVGLRFQASGAPRAAAEVWLRTALSWAGFGNELLLPALMCGGLALAAAWRGERWLPRPRVGALVIAECAAWGVGLAWLATPVSAALGAPTAAVWAWLTPAPCAPGPVEGMVLTLGAGVYEEALFRWLLLPLSGLVLLRIGVRPVVSWTAAVIVVNLLFAVAHGSGSFQSAALLTRMLGGAALSLIYWERGLGIAAGAHLAYDLLVGW